MFDGKAAIIGVIHFCITTAMVVWGYFVSFGQSFNSSRLGSLQIDAINILLWPLNPIWATYFAIVGDGTLLLPEQLHVQLLIAIAGSCIFALVARWLLKTFHLPWL